MKCKTCKELEVIPSFTEVIASWIVHNIFPRTLDDERQEARLEGFSQGYEFELQQLILQIIKNNFPNV